MENLINKQNAYKNVNKIKVWRLNKNYIKIIYKSNFNFNNFILQLF